MSDEPTTCGPLQRIVRRLYADRQHEELGEHYVRHVEAMTAEKLYAKSDIAAELAYRDAEIERLLVALREIGDLAHDIRATAYRNAYKPPNAAFSGRGTKEDQET